MRPTSRQISRRELLRQSAQAAAWLALAAHCAPLLAAPDKRRFRLGACDWSIGKMGDPAAFEVGRAIGDPGEISGVKVIPRPGSR